MKEYPLIRKIANPDSYSSKTSLAFSHIQERISHLTV
jgi:hypothetical protein